MLGIAVIVLVDCPTIQHHLLEQPSLNHFAKGAVDRWPTRPAASWRLLKFSQQLFGIEMFVASRDVVDNHLPLPGNSLTPSLHELCKAFLRRQGRRNGAK